MENHPRSSNTGNKSNLMQSMSDSAYLPSMTMVKQGTQKAEKRPFPAPDAPEEELVATQPYVELTQDVPDQDIVAILVPRCAEMQEDYRIYKDVKEIWIGREPQPPRGSPLAADRRRITLHERRISTKHIRLFRYDAPHRGNTGAVQFAIEDKSANGSFLNGRKMEKNKQYQLRSGDEVSLATNSVKQRRDNTNDVVFAFMLSIVEDQQIREGVLRDGGAIIEDKYNLSSRSLGSGNFSHVLLCTDKATNEQRALKMVDRKKFLQFQNKRSSQLTLRSEANCLKSMDHPNIVKLFDMFETDQHLFLIMELCEGGDLLQAILDNGIYPELLSRRLFGEVCSGLQYLHSLGIVHRDMKPENVLLTSQDPQKAHVKISDFGLATNIAEKAQLMTFCGTPHYFAPEIIKFQEGRLTGYGMEVDAWAAGVVLYILLSGIPPFADENLYEQISQGQFDFSDAEWKTVSKSGQNLVQKLMVVNPAERMTISEALQHPWLSGSGLSQDMQAWKLQLSEAEEGDLKRRKMEDSPSKMEVSPEMPSKDEALQAKVSCHEIDVDF